MKRSEYISDGFKHAVKKAFNGFYPNLHLDFKEKENGVRFKKRDLRFWGDDKFADKDAADFLLREIEISDQMTVEDFRQKMASVLSEEVHVSRRFHNTWIKISLTGDWTLGRQNERAGDI